MKLTLLRPLTTVLMLAQFRDRRPSTIHAAAAALASQCRTLYRHRPCTLPFTCTSLSLIDRKTQVWPTTDPSNIHPLNKQDVSVRLASQILGIEYGVGQPLVFPTYVGASLVNYGPASLTSVDVQLRGCTGGCSVLPAFYPPGCMANTSASFMLLIADASGKVTRINATAVPLAGMSSLRISIAAPAYPFTVFGSSYGHASYEIQYAHNTLTSSNHLSLSGIQSPTPSTLRLQKSHLLLICYCLYLYLSVSIFCVCVPQF